MAGRGRSSSSSTTASCCTSSARRVAPMTAVGRRRSPTLAIDMTATRIVAGAIATRDFMPVHHDRDYANSQGAPDIFMNIISTNGYCSRYLTDWAGPDAMLKRLAIRLGVPGLPGLDADASPAPSPTSRARTATEVVEDRVPGEQRPRRPRHRHGHARRPAGAS